MKITDISIDVVHKELDNYFTSKNQVKSGPLFLTWELGKLRICSNPKASNPNTAKIPDRLITNYLNTLNTHDPNQKKSLKDKVSNLRGNVPYSKRLKTFFKNLTKDIGFDSLKNRMEDWDINDVSENNTSLLLDNPLILNILPQAIEFIEAKFDINTNERNLLEHVSQEVQDKISDYNMTEEHINQFEELSQRKFNSTSDMLELNFLELSLESTLGFLKLVVDEISNISSSTDLHINTTSPHKPLSQFIDLYENISDLVDTIEASFNLGLKNDLDTHKFVIDLYLENLDRDYSMISQNNAIDILVDLFIDHNDRLFDPKLTQLFNQIINSAPLLTLKIEKKWLNHILSIENQPELSKECLLTFYTKTNQDMKLLNTLVLDLADNNSGDFEKLINKTIAYLIIDLDNLTYQSAKELYDFWSGIQDRIDHDEISKIINQLEKSIDYLHYMDYKKEFDVTDFEQLESILGSQVQRENDTVDFTPSKIESTLLYQEHIWTEGTTEKVAVDKLMSDLKKNLGPNAEAQELYSKISDNYDLLTYQWHLGEEFEIEETSKWTAQIFVKARDLAPGESFLFHISPMAAQHAIYAKLEKKENQKYKLFIGNTGAGIKSNPDFHPINKDSGLYQTTAFVDDVKLDLTDILKLSQTIGLGYQYCADISEGKLTVNTNALINRLYDTIRDHFGTPQQVSAEDNPNFWSRAQLGGSCTMSCLWTLLKTDLPDKTVRKLKNRIRLKLLIELTREYKSNPEAYQDNFRLILDLATKLKQVLNTKYSTGIENINKHLYVLNRVLDDIYFIEDTNFKEKKFKIDIEELEGIRASYQSNTTVQNLLDIYTNIASRDMRGLEQILENINLTKLKNDIQKLDPNAIDKLFGIYLEFTKKIEDAPSRSESIQNIIISQITRYMFISHGLNDKIKTINKAKNKIGYGANDKDILTKYYGKSAQRKMNVFLKPDQYFDEYTNILQFLSEFDSTFNIHY